MSSVEWLVPRRYEKLYTRLQIKEQVESIGRQITCWGNKQQQATGLPVVAVCVLRGGVFFYSDLLRSLAFSVETAFCRSEAYCKESNQELEQSRIELICCNVAGRSVLMVDEICDSGKTLALISKTLKDAGAGEIRSVSLVRRIVPKPQFVPDWSCFDYHGEEWLVGLGLDDANRYSNLPEIYRIKSEIQGPDVA
ncbi:MAG: phosphoribosyltransferase family protein [bacterium]|nr:phosphoribosyltransferase family protein [bacterium]